MSVEATIPTMSHQKNLDRDVLWSISVNLYKRCLFYYDPVLNFPNFTTNMPVLAEWNQAKGCNGIFT